MVEGGDAAAPHAEIRQAEVEDEAEVLALVVALLYANLV